MRLIVLLLTTVTAAFASKAVFSVHDDLLAFPQYQVIISDGFVSDEEAERHINLTALRETTKHKGSAAAAELTRHNDPSKDQPPIGVRTNADTPDQLYEQMVLNGQQYLCAIPIVATPEKNETSQAEEREEQERELARATDRGWQLLNDMQGCLYYISGWWSYSFCHNKQVKQFHQLPPGKGVPMYPPAEDPAVPSFVLGQYRSKKGTSGKTAKSTEDVARGAGELGVAQLQARGETRYLVQKLGGGTTCDLTGKERKIEVQFHCHPQSVDRIGWIKEISTCSYLMVIYTPRLCNDVAFLPPRENRANAITCREIVPEDDIPAWKTRKATEIQQQLIRAAHEPAEEESSKPRPIVGGIEVGGKKDVGGDGRYIETSSNAAAKAQASAEKDQILEVVAMGFSKAEGGEVQSLDDEDLKRLDLDPKNIDDLRKELQELAGDKAWRLEVIELADGVRHIRGVLDVDEADEEYDEEYNGEEYPEGEGNQERKGQNDDSDEDDKGWSFKEEL